MTDHDTMQPGSHVLTDENQRAEYVGFAKPEPTLGYVRDRNGAVETVLMEDLRLDPAFHYDAALAPDGDGELCACGHSYGRHFDGYERDPLYPKKPKHAGCKYCGCHLWEPATKDNQRNRVHDHRLYTVRVTRDLVLHRYTDRRTEKLADDYELVHFSEGAVLHDLSLIHHDVVSMFVEGQQDGQPFSVTDFPADALEVLGRRWEDGYNPHETDLKLEEFQDEPLTATPAPEAENPSAAETLVRSE